MSLKTNPTVYELDIPDKWKFTDEFPKEFRNLRDKKLLQDQIWYIKKQIRYKTEHKDRGKKLKNYQLPMDLCLYSSPLTKNEKNKMYQHLEKLFKEYKDLGIQYSDQKSSRGLVYLFTGDAEKTQYHNATMAFLKKYNFEMYSIMNKYVSRILKIYDLGIKKGVIEWLDEHLQIIFLKYDPNQGIWIHIDNVARYDRGPIITTSIGPTTTYYDLTPTLLHKNKELKPIRVEVCEGDIVVMDGSSRMEWAHGLPYNVPYKKTKYSILFKFNKFGVQHKIHNKILKTDISTSKAICRL